MSEECLRVLSGTTRVRTLWAHGAVTESLNPLRVNERTDILHVHLLNLVVLMRSTEAVKEVDEWHRALKCGKVRHGREIHNLLYRA